MKSTVLKLYSQGIKGRDIITLTGVNKFTCYSWIHRFKKDNKKQTFFNEHERKNWLV